MTAATEMWAKKHTELTTEIERLRAALYEISEVRPFISAGIIFDTAQQLAKAALGHQQSVQPDEPSEVTVPRMRSEDWPDRQ